tara:strand:+ start:8138 stop:8362 length:225 start_codon:yes stop_codon:yes gene_type:complete
MFAAKISDYLRKKEDREHESEGEDAREAFDAFVKAHKKGDNEDAFEALKAVIYECIQHEKGGGVGVMIALGPKK